MMAFMLAAATTAKILTAANIAVATGSVAMAVQPLIDRIKGGK